MKCFNIGRLWPFLPTYHLSTNCRRHSERKECSHDHYQLQILPCRQTHLQYRRGEEGREEGRERQRGGEERRGEEGREGRGEGRREEGRELLKYVHTRYAVHNERLHDLLHVSTVDNTHTNQCWTFIFKPHNTNVRNVHNELILKVCMHLLCPPRKNISASIFVKKLP